MMAMVSSYRGVSVSYAKLGFFCLGMKKYFLGTEGYECCCAGARRLFSYRP